MQYRLNSEKVSQKTMSAESSQRLKAFRSRHGMSQARAAEACNTPKRTWEGWENGEDPREPPACLWLLLQYFEAYGPIQMAQIEESQEGTFK